MELIDYLGSVINRNDSIVQTQLAREDLARIKKLHEFASVHENYTDMEKAGLYIEWTKGDFRTHELSIPLKALMRAIFDYRNAGEVSGSKSEEHTRIDMRIMDIWAAFHTLRLKVLVHCL